MEDESSTSSQLREKSREALHALQAGNIRGFLQKSPGEEMKQEQVEGQLQRWEIQWQEFLKTVEASPSNWKNPQLRDERASSGVPQVVPTLLQGQSATVEQVAQNLPDPCKSHGQVYNKLKYGDLGQMKEEMEGQEALATEVQRQRFRKFLYLDAEGPRGVCFHLQELCRRWLQPERHTKEQILELVILEQFLAVLPQEMLNWVKQRGPETCFQATYLAEEFLLEKQAVGGLEEQGCEQSKKSALNNSKTAQSSLGCWQVPFFREVEQEGNTGGGSFPDKQIKNTNEEEKCGLEGSYHVAASDVSKGKANEMLFQSHRWESRGPPGPGQKEKHPKVGMRESVPSQGSKLVFETSIQDRRHQWQNPHTAGGRSFQRSSDIVKCEPNQVRRKRYLCSDCGRTFFMFLALRTHQRTHGDYGRSQARGVGHTVDPMLPCFPEYKTVMANLFETECPNCNPKPTYLSPSANTAI